MLLPNKITLVIFTCEGREFHLRKTYDSFLAACDYPFNRVILAIDGPVNTDIIDHIKPDLIVYGLERRGYVANIKNVLPNIDTEYFFWMEDDWTFHKKVEVSYFTGIMAQNPDWVQIAYSKYGPLAAEFKATSVGINLFANIYGYTTNPGYNRTHFLQEAFDQLHYAKKGGKLGVDGFENFLARYFLENHVSTIIHDPVEGFIISHEGYLETTARNWHMTNSLEERTKEHLLTMPAPSIFRKLFMVLKLAKAFFKLSVKQLFNNKVYELCFRVIASAITIDHND